MRLFHTAGTTDTPTAPPGTGLSLPATLSASPNTNVFERYSTTVQSSSSVGDLPLSLILLSLFNVYETLRAFSVLSALSTGTPLGLAAW